MPKVKTKETTLQKPFSFSQGSLQDYAECRRRFYLKYIEKLAWPAVDQEPVLDVERRMAEGEAFHHMVHQFWLGVPEKRLEVTANTPNLRRWWENFRRERFELGGYRLYPEYTLVAQMGEQRLAAKFDLLAVSEDKAIIFDWKTNLKLPKREWLAVNFQTKVYRSMLVQSGSYFRKNKAVAADEIEMIYWMANFPEQSFHFEYSARQAEQDEKELKDLIHRIVETQEFPMTQELKRCEFCRFRSYCERGMAASADQDDLFDIEEGKTIDWETIPEIEF